MTSINTLKIQNDTKIEQLEEDYDKLMKELNKTPVDAAEVEWRLTSFKSTISAYFTFQQKYIEALLKANKIEEYKQEEKRINTLLKQRGKVETMAAKIFPQSTSGSSSQSSSPSPESSRINLPQRELPKYDGDVRQWLAFWSCFEEIDNDSKLSDVQKFNILMQCVVTDSPAHEVVKSFPPKSENYKKATTRLHERFGRPTMLVKVYVRDLLRLVIDNSTGRTNDFITLVTQLTSQIRNLESLGVTQDKCAQILYPVVESCLPDDVLQVWQRHNSFAEDLEKLMTFLEEEVNNKTERTLAQSFITKPKKISEVPANPRKSSTPTAASLLSGDKKATQTQCVFSDGSHNPEVCRKAAEMFPRERKERVIKKGHCLSCLKKNHTSQNCRSKKFLQCLLCQGNHHTIICQGKSDSPEKEQERKLNQANPKLETVPVPPPFQSSSTPSTSTGGNTVQNVRSCANQLNSPDVPLQVLVVICYGANGRRKQVRAIMDPGSQRSYVTTSLARELQLPKEGEETIISDLFGGSSTERFTTPILKLMLSRTDGSNLTMFNVSTITTIISPTEPTPTGRWIQDFAKQGIEFEDTRSTSPAIDVLIGDDVAAKMYTGRIVHLPYGPSAMETCLGWALCGKLPVKPRSASTLIVKSLLSPVQPISDLWALETIGILDSSQKQNKKELEENAMQHFKQTVQRNDEGRYEVELPFLDGTRSMLPSNYFLAERRLRSATRTIKIQGYFDDYDKVFQQWEADTMIEIVGTDSTPTSHNQSLNDNVHYLPHRAIIKNNSTTPIRPVFDASAKAKGKFSLNDCLEKGPNLLELIPAIMIRFRLYSVGAVADIKKAFQMISVKPEHRDYLRFLWWTNNNCDNIKIYRHTRVVFGVSSSPFLLGATIHHHLQSSDPSEADTVSKLIDNMYVDNCVVSLNTMKEAKRFQNKAQQLFLPAHFDLRGWEFSHSSEEKLVPVLGLIWKTRQDVLSIDTNTALQNNDHECTQRKVLSLCHTLFDPLGFVSPFILVGKLILRQCHELKLGWDTPLPWDLEREFLKWKEEINFISELQIPRHVKYELFSKSLHVFCDASSSAYAAAIFLRVELQPNGPGDVHLIVAKSRVAPQKKLSIPRLELLSCLIAARLLHTVTESLKNPVIPVILWSDSTTALAWIRGDGPWTTFVQNRVNEIRQLTNINNWFHVPGKENPADLPSRGCSARKLLQSRWWEGPCWLRNPPESWPTESASFSQDEINQEKKKNITTLLTTDVNQDFIIKLTKLSSYFQVIRAVVVLRRFTTYLIAKHLKKQTVNATYSRILTQEELQQSEEAILIVLQQQVFQDKKLLKKLHVFEEGGLLRIKSRLTHDDTTDFLFPIVLPGNHPLVHMLILGEHIHHSHAGVQFTLALRERYWILNGRRSVRKVIKNCAVCRRFTATKVTVPEAPLPKLRTGELVAFSTTGVDMAGPLHLKNGNKTWIALFTCATYRAVHMELTETLSTDGFLQCLRRFIARRGRPQNIYSDNGLNFTGVSNQMKKIDWTKVEKYATTSKINWIFNPPSAAWWGGWWERLIGLIKQLLRRILGNRVVNYEELLTLTTEIEEVLNNRPLTPLTEDPDDLLALTPNHFTRNSMSAYLPEMDVRDGGSMRKVYKKLQHLRQTLRSRFRREYLGFLRQKHSSKPNQTLKPGDVVLVESDLQKRLDWPIAIIREAYPGRDGHIRTYRIHTKNGDLVRPAQRLLPLEIVE